MTERIGEKMVVTQGKKNSSERCKSQTTAYTFSVPCLFISAADEDILAKGKQSIKSQALGNQNLENETLLEGDDDTLSSMDEKDLENLTGKFSGCAHTSASSGPRSI